MARQTYAAKALIEQVQAEKPKATIENHGDPDGLGVYRTLKFDKTTSKWLAPLLEVINDPRIDSAEVTDAGYLHVTFVPNRAADDRAQFALDEAAAALKNEQSPAE